MYIIYVWDKIQRTHFNVMIWSAERFSVSKFFIFLIRSRDERSAIILLQSLMLLGNCVHSRNTASIRFDGCAKK